MDSEIDWNESAREELRTRIRERILGEIRLARRTDQEIIDTCRDVYISDDCPENEQPAFVEFAAGSLELVKGEHLQLMATWPAVTDCDRLDKADAALRARGILLWQVSPCCDTCTLAEMSGRIDTIIERDPGFSERLRGYAFFIDQNMPHELSERTLIAPYLGYGWYSPDGSNVEPALYEQHALGIANEIRECLQAEGLTVLWDGSFSRKIGVEVNWQRREMLI
jgi:hypothetical protein